MCFWVGCFLREHSGVHKKKNGASHHSHKTVTPVMTFSSTCVLRHSFSVSQPITQNILIYLLTLLLSCSKLQSHVTGELAKVWNAVISTSSQSLCWSKGQKKKDKLKSQGWIQRMRLLNVMSYAWKPSLASMARWEETRAIIYKLLCMVLKDKDVFNCTPKYLFS